MAHVVPIPKLADFPPFLLQAAPAGENVLWETFAAFDTREEARPFREELASAFLTSGVDLDDEGSCSPTITRLVSVLELLQEGPDAVYAAIVDLISSAEQHVLFLGGDTEAMEALLLDKMLGEAESNPEQKEPT